MEQTFENNDLPNDWSWCSMKIIAKLINGDRGKNYPSRSNYVSHGIPFISAGNIDNGKLLLQDLNYISEERYELLNGGKLIEGDILYCIRGTLGKSAIFHRLKKGAIASSLVIIRVSKQFNTKYIFYYLQSPYGKHLINQYDNGTAQPNLSARSVSKYAIPLAPLPEQRAIIAKVEELLSKLDNGIDNLKKAKDKLEIYRQAVLKKAFEGELTKEWREKQPNLPYADELLEQIKQERKNYYESQLQEWKTAIKKWEENGKEGKKPRKPKKVKTLPAFTEAELTDFSDLPLGWEWVKVDSIQGHDRYSIKAGPFGSALKKSCYVKEGYKVYGQEQVIASNWKIGDYYVDQNKYEELETCAVHPKDILISLVGTVGNVLVLPDEIKPGLINPRLVKITLAYKYYLPEFFKYYFESEYLKSIYSKKSHGATMDIINLGIIRDLPFPLLSKAEQIKIVEEIETRLSVCDNILANINEGLEKAKAFRQSILKKAFEGKLLIQEELETCRRASDWEPAEKLLDRIKKEKE